MSEPTACHKSFKEKLTPPPTQERALEQIVWRCRTLYKVAREQRIPAWQRCHVALTRYQQEAELKAIRAEFPEGLRGHPQPGAAGSAGSARHDTTYHACFRRLTNGEKPGFPRFQGRDRSHSFPYQEYGNGARLDNGALVRAKIGRIAVRWSRRIEGSSKTVTLRGEADGW